MSGAAGMRGYLLQTLVALLDSMEPSNNWEQIAIEPSNSDEKVDILWVSDELRKAVQVKSSRNQISLPTVKKWAKELEETQNVDVFELILIGPASQGVIDLKEYRNVKIPCPLNLDITGLIEQCAHRLDKYLEMRGIPNIPAFARELLTSAMITKLEAYSTSGEYISRNDFEKILSDWLFVSYPRSINMALTMQCTMACNSITLPGTGEPSISRNLPVLLPITLVNDTPRACIINLIAIKILGNSSPMLYTPVSTVDFEKFIQGKIALNKENIKAPFTEFVIPRESTYSEYILFVQGPEKDNYPIQEWIPGMYTFQVFIKYGDSETPFLIKELKMEITDDTLENYQNGGTSSNLLCGDFNI